MQASRRWSLHRVEAHRGRDPRLDWNYVAWIEKRWGGKLIPKGIMDVEDARLAAVN